jgi:hypothetical protein
MPGVLAARRCLVMTVLLASRGNPDLGEDERRPMPGVPRQRAKALTLREASELCRAYIEQYDLGGSQWAGGLVLDDAGEPFARISYNGRAWSLGTPETELAL